MRLAAHQSNHPNRWVVEFEVHQAPTHPSGALVRPDPSSSSCVYELAYQSQDGKCRI